ncbi:hypothetical protein SAMN06264364_119110 [Quadrisphaera granulorum]|uniref:Uncharacterized protein n=1 Tax=Quadrisphaera granulorum TaxID=317664 RepID=A0A316A4K4_9ACTN|nr:hypothetical protein [Quadrisphaera granulorum]PWJ52615.1 hypothetical protein BXY45_119110 [Quadrisphaera granulorum]SZE97665.1 hypothetical protein SAMN06264364_119110 [Quadrisphaera granulorum]
MDPSDSRHIDARDWLGLDDDASFDASLADLAAADARLAWLRPALS